MGILRLFFALSVLIGHSGLFGGTTTTSNLAVYSFFVISGFYMALILDKKYIKEKAKKFFSNRLLRIFPLYWATLLIFVSLSVIKFFFNIGTNDNAISHYLQYSPSTSPVSFFIEIINFIFRNITLIFTTDYFLPSNNTPGYLLVQQAWSLQIELLFYLIAPLLVKMSKKTFIIFTIIYLIGFFGIARPLNLIPVLTLTDAFLSNLIFFLLGIASYNFLFRKIEKKTFFPKFKRYMFIGFIFYLLFYSFIPVKLPLAFINISDIFYYLILASLIPFIFISSAGNLLDKFIGELSYPVYITHFLVIKIVSNAEIFNQNVLGKTILIVVLTLLLSIFLVKIIDEPIDKLRQRRITNKGI